jgi:tetratricopeptide (TPR) repeat protein
MHRTAKSFALVFLGTSLGLSSLMAQKGQSPPAGNTGNTGGPATTTSTPTQTTQPPQQSNPVQIPRPQMPIFLSGRVMMEDGTPPPNSLAIQRLCSGSPHTVAYTNSKGQFNFEWGSPSGIVADASESMSPISGMRGGEDTAGFGGTRGGQMESSMGGPSLMGCELLVNAPGFRSDRLDLSNHRAADNPELGTIILHRMAEVEGTSVSATTLNAPKDARKSWEKGQQLLHAAQKMTPGPKQSGRDAKLAEAEKELQKAVELYPKFAAAWLDLGRTRLLQGETAPGKEALLKSLEVDSKLVEPYVELGEQSAREQSWADAAKYMDYALKLDPVDFPRLWFEDAVANYNTQNFERAEKNAREALKLPPARSDPHANQLLGLILINKHDYAGAGEALRAYVRLAPGAKDIEQVKAQLDQINSRLAVTAP